MDKITLGEALTWIAPMFGGGALTTLVVAWIGSKRASATPPHPPTTPIQVESPWLTQHLIEMHYEIERIKELMAVMSNQIAGITSLLKRRNGRQQSKKN